jgi:hypothetical protein
MSTYYNQYMYLHTNQAPYVDKNGKTANANARWFFEPTGGDSAAGKCCWNRQVQGCSLDSTCDAGNNEGCIYSGMATKQYGVVQCNVTRCCWDRLLQSCKQNSDCDPGGEGCVTSGTETFTYGRFQCNTCEMQGQVYDPKTYSCKAKFNPGP